MIYKFHLRFGSNRKIWFKSKAKKNENDIQTWSHFNLIIDLNLINITPLSILMHDDCGVVIHTCECSYTVT